MDDFDGLLNWEPLQAWVSKNPIPGDGEVVAVELLAGGSQNNVFKMTREDRSAFVLRRPPRHLRKNSNSTMLREARVLQALAGSDVPRPDFYAVCDDESVIGTCFYTMSMIDGFVPQGQLPERWATDDFRHELGYAMVDAVAKLGAIDYEKVGLSDFGKPDNWLGQQVPKWRQQLEGYRELDGYDGSELDRVDRVGDWLSANQPESCKIGIIHGDYQFANVMLSHTEPKVAAIIDWEISSLGDPLLDLAWLLTAWGEPHDPPGNLGQLSPWYPMPSRADLINRYGDLSGRDMSSMSWYFVLACYKLGILLEGTHARACAGQADKSMGDIMHAVATWRFAKAHQLIDES